MDFGRLYPLIKKNNDLYSEAKEACEELCLSRKITLTNNPNLAIKANSICYNKCSFCTNPAKGKYLDLNLVVPYLNKSKIAISFKNNIFQIKPSEVVQLTGGEPFLHPEKNLEGFLEKFVKLKGSDSVIGIMTSGINPDAPKEMIERYYRNFSMLAEISSKTNHVSLCFSYSGGIKLDERLTNFLKYYNKLVNSSRMLLDFRVLLNDVQEKKIKTERLNKIIKIKPKEVEYCSITTKEMVENTLIDNDCNLWDDDLMIDLSGNFSICCSPFNDFKPLPAYAKLGELLETVLDKRIVYLGLMRLFEKSIYEKISRGLSCLNCVNFFDNYLSRIYEDIFKNK